VVVGHRTKHGAGNISSVAGERQIFLDQPLPCASSKHSKPCATRSDAVMGVLKQKVKMEIPV
jgi:hypothetical protein